MTRRNPSAGMLGRYFRAFVSFLGRFLANGSHPGRGPRMRTAHAECAFQVRVISKSVIRRALYGAGRRLSFEVCDESGELRCTCFNEGVDKNFLRFPPR